MDWNKLLTKDNAITAGEIIGGFIPGISEAIDVKDVIQGVKDKNFLQAGLGLAGLAIPGISVAQIKTVAKGGIKGVKKIKKSAKFLTRDEAFEKGIPYVIKDQDGLIKFAKEDGTYQFRKNFKEVSGPSDIKEIKFAQESDLEKNFRTQLSKKEWDYVTSPKYFKSEAKRLLEFDNWPALHIAVEKGNEKAIKVKALLEEIAAHPEKVKYATGDIRGLSKNAIWLSPIHKKGMAPSLADQVKFTVEHLDPNLEKQLLHINGIRQGRQASVLHKNQEAIRSKTKKGYYKDEYWDATYTGSDPIQTIIYGVFGRSGNKSKKSSKLIQNWEERFQDPNTLIKSFGLKRGESAISFGKEVSKSVNKDLEKIQKLLYISKLKSSGKMTDVAFKNTASAILSDNPVTKMWLGKSAIETTPYAKFKDISASQTVPRNLLHPSSDTDVEVIFEINNLLKNISTKLGKRSGDSVTTLYQAIDPNKTISRMNMHGAAWRQNNLEKYQRQLLNESGTSPTYLYTAEMADGTKRLFQTNDQFAALIKNGDVGIVENIMDTPGAASMNDIIMSNWDSAFTFKQGGILKRK